MGKVLIAAAVLVSFLYKFDNMKRLSKSVAHCVAIHRQ